MSHTDLQYIPTIPDPTSDLIETIDDDKRELVAVERLFAAMLTDAGVLGQRGAELNARVTSMITAMHGLLDAVDKQQRATRSSMAGPLRRWRGERARIRAWLASRVGR